MSTPLLTRLRTFAHKVLGKHYAAFLDTADRAVAAFGSTVAAQAIGAGLLNVSPLQHTNEWQQIGVAGLVAAVSIIKSTIVTAITGTPAVLSLASRTLRARRDQPAVQHHVPLRKSHTKGGRNNG